MMETKPEIKKEKEVLRAENALCLVEFSNGCLKKKHNSVKFELFREANVNQMHKRILVASTNHLIYSGTNYETNMFHVTSSVLKIAILNKITQRFKLYDVDYFVLRPILKCDIFADTVLKSKIEQNQSLTLEFGGKTKKKNLSSKLKLQAGEAINTSNENLLQQISELPSTTLDIKPALVTTTFDDIIPPVNQTASSPAEVYNIFDIIPNEVNFALETEIEIFKDITFETLLAWKNESKFSDIIIHYLEMNIHSVTSNNAKILCYVQYLIIFLNVKYTELRKKDPFPEIPQAVKQGMIKRYNVNRSFSQRMKDKLLADLIIICLHLYNFSVNATILVSSAKIAMKRLVNIAYALGCHVHSSKGDTSKRFELKLPLFKYEPPRKFRK